MLYRHDIEILAFFSEQKEYLFDSETPFVALELERLVKEGYLLKSTKMKYGAPAITRILSLLMRFLRSGELR